MNRLWQAPDSPAVGTARSLERLAQDPTLGKSDRAPHLVSVRDAARVPTIVAQAYSTDHQPNRSLKGEPRCLM